MMLHLESTPCLVVGQLYIMRRSTGSNHSSVTMLWRTLLCCLAIAGWVSVDAWEPLVQYQYDVEMRTLTSLPEVAEIYTGSIIKLKFDLTTITKKEYTAKISNAKDGILSPTHLPGGWNSPIPDKELDWQVLPISRQPFHVEMDGNGTVKKVFFEPGLKGWEKDMINAMVMQLQVVPRANPSRKQPFVNPPTGKSTKFSAFHTNETSLLGECDVLYVTRPLTSAEVLHEHYPIAGDIDNHLIITKSWNLTNCKKVEQFTMGFSEADGKLPISRSSQSKILVHGDIDNFTIKIVETNSTFFVPPQLYNKQKSMVATNFKATLLTKSRNPNPLPKPQQPEGRETSVPEQLQNYQGYMKDMNYMSGVYIPTPSDEAIRESYRQSSKLLIPFLHGFNGKRIGSAQGVNISELMVSMAEDISEKLYTEPTPQTLSEVIVAVKHMRTMYLEEIDAAQNIIAKKEQHKEVKLGGKVLRNIVALSGTPYSLQALYLWLQNGMITIQEFSHYFSVQREVTFVLNYHYLDTLKEVTMAVDKMEHPDKQELQSLRATVGLTFADILRLAGNKHPEIKAAAVKYYTVRLEEAIKTQNNEELQLIIRILGNIATKDILEPLYKIISGERNMTEHIRLHTLSSLDLLTELHPKGMNKFWFSIFVNTTLPHQLRCQAVPNIMRSNPPAWMLQQMAEATHNESNPHVISQISSAIQSAAQLRGRFNIELAQNARAARSLLKPSVHDAGYSGVYLDSYKIDGMELSYTQSLNYIGSQDSLVPSSFQYFVKKNYNGFRPLDLQVSGMVTSANDTLEAILNALLQPKPAYQQAPTFIGTTPFSRIHVQRRPKLEGNLNIPGVGFWSFDGQTLQKKISETIKKFDGRSVPLETMKMSNSKELMYAVPNGIGLTFIYTHSSVYLTNIKGNVKLQKNVQDEPISWSSKSWATKLQSSTLNLTVDGNIDVTLALREESKVGFITPWNSLDYINGLNVNTQVRAPVDVSVGVELDNKLNDIKLSTNVSLPKTKPVNIFHRSSEPYVTKISLLGNPTTTNNPNTTVLHTKPPVTSNIRFGKDSTGVDLRLDYYSEIDASYANIVGEEPQFLKEKSPLSTLYRWLYQQWKGYNTFSLIHFPFASRDIHVSSLNITYDPSESTTHTARFAWRIGEFPTPAGIVGNLKTQKQKYHPRSLGVPLSVEVPAQQQVPAPGSIQRQVLLNATFEGKTVAVFGLYGAIRSSVMNQSANSTVQLWAKPAVSQQINAALELALKVPQVNLLNFKQALLESPNSTIEALVTIARPNWAKPASILLTGNLGRTPQREEYLRESPMGKACLAEMESGLNIQRTCQNVTNWANSLDAYEVNIRYKHIPIELKRVAFAAYSAIRQAAFSQLQEDVFNVNPSAHSISAGLYINNQSTALNISIQSSIVNANITNLPIPTLAQPVILNAGISLPDRIGQHLYPLNYAPSFVLENGQIVTFDGKSYPLKASTCWYIALAYAPKWVSSAPDNQEQIYNYKDLRNVVQIRQTQEGLLETKIIDNNLVVELRGQQHTPTPTIYVNGDVMELQPEQPMAVSETAVIHLLREGEVALHFNESHIVDIYQDSRRLKITPRSCMKDSVLGLAGNYNGNPEDDLVSPAGCIRNDPEAFQAEWADCQLPTKESKCVYVHNSTVYHPQPVQQPNNSPYTELPRHIFDDFDSCSDSSESQESPSDSPDFSSFLGLAGRAPGFKVDGEISPTSTGAQVSLLGLEGHVGFQTSQSVIYKTDVQHFEGVTCFSRNPIRKCREDLVPERQVMETLEYHCMMNGPMAELYEENVERHHVIEDLKSKTVHKQLTVLAAVECRQQ